MQMPFRKSEAEAKKNTKVKLYPNREKCKISCWDRPIYTVPGYEEVFVESIDKNYAEATSRVVDVEKLREELERKREEFDPSTVTGKKNAKKREKTTDKEKLEKNLKDAQRRAKNKIFEIALANEWDYMITLTLDKEKIDRTDPKEVQKLIAKWFDNNVQRRKIKYLCIPEYHKKGGIHMHGLVSGELDYVFSGNYKIEGERGTVKLKKLKSMGYNPEDKNVHEVYNIDNFSYGFTTALKIYGNREKVSFYMTKYITKDLKKIFGSYYKAGGDIKRQLDTIVTDLNFSSMAMLENCKTVELPNNLGTVRYADVSLSQFAEIVAPHCYDIVFDKESPTAYFVDDDGCVIDERSLKHA